MIWCFSRTVDNSKDERSWQAAVVSIVILAEIVGENTLSSEQLPVIFTTEILAT
jgi:hypothetical protein